jgi:phosphoglycolate phosphatase
LSGKPEVRFEAIIWDWNGTLLNDVHIAIESINQLLRDRKLIPLNLERYLDVFMFPVQDYYEQIGFDLKNEPFEISASQFIAIYNKAVDDSGLHEDVIPLLSQLQQRGYRQFILSAMEQQTLEKTVNDNGISGFFEDLCGLSDHYAKSKVENGKSLILERGLDPERTLLIGDTTHDYDVALAIGCSCVLIAQGHQSKKRLLSSGAVVFDRLDEIVF